MEICLCLCAVKSVMETPLLLSSRYSGPALLTHLWTWLWNSQRRRPSWRGALGKLRLRPQPPAWHHIVNLLFSADQIPDGRRQRSQCVSAHRDQERGHDCYPIWLLLQRSSKNCKIWMLLSHELTLTVADSFKVAKGLSAIAEQTQTWATVF